MLLSISAADFLDAAFDLALLAFAADNGGVLLVGGNLIGAAQVLNGGRLELAAEFLGDHRAAGQDSDILQHGFAAIAKARGFNGQHIEHAAQFVQYESGEGFAIDIFSDDNEFTLANLDEFLQQRDDVLGSGDLLLIDQNISIGDDGFHLVGIGDEVSRKVAAIELHAFDKFGLIGHGLGLFDGNDAVLADLVHYVCDQFADMGFRGRVGGDGGDLFLAYRS